MESATLNLSLRCWQFSMPHGTCDSISQETKSGICCSIQVKSRDQAFHYVDCIQLCWKAKKANIGCFCEDNMEPTLQFRSSKLVQEPNNQMRGAYHHVKKDWRNKWELQLKWLWLEEEHCWPFFPLMVMDAGWNHIYGILGLAMTWMSTTQVMVRLKLGLDLGVTKQ